MGVNLATMAQNGYRKINFFDLNQLVGFGELAGTSTTKILKEYPLQDC